MSAKTTQKKSKDNLDKKRKLVINLPKLSSLRNIFSYTGLLFMLLALFFQPLFIQSQFGRFLFDVIISVTIIGGMTLIHGSKRERTFAVFFAIVTVVLRWLGHLHHDAASAAILSSVFPAMFFAYTSLRVFSHIVSAQTITHDTMSAAVCLYLMIGIVFAFLFTCINTIHPGSFTLPPGSDPAFLTKDPRMFIYFSFTTLTTVGFGDTVPTTDIARALTVVEAICGQMFIAILVANLVGKKIAHSTMK